MYSVPSHNLLVPRKHWAGCAAVNTTCIQHTHYGIIASGDEDIVAFERAQALHVQTEALAFDWEGAGVARACRFSGIPYLEIRAITDTANYDASVAFETNLGMAMENLGKFFVQVFLK